MPADPEMTHCAIIRERATAVNAAISDRRPPMPVKRAFANVDRSRPLLCFSVGAAMDADEMVGKSRVGHRATAPRHVAADAAAG